MKCISHVVRTVRKPRFARDYVRLYVACGDGSTYIAERSLDCRRMAVKERIDSDGSRTASPSRLPERIEGHLKWRLCETPCYLV